MKRKNFIKVLLPILLSGIFLCLAGVAAVREELLLFLVLLVGAIIMSLGLPTILISLRLDERFDQIEDVLRKIEQYHKNKL